MMWNKADSLGDKNFKQTTRDLLLATLQQVEHKTGSIRIWKKSKEEAKLFFKQGLLVSVDVSTLSLNLQNHVLASQKIHQSSRRDQVLERVEQHPDESDNEFIFYLLQQHLFPENALNDYMKERFIDFLLHVFQWEDVNGEWRLNDEPAGPTIPSIDPDAVYKHVLKLEEYFTVRLVPAWGMSPENVGDIAYVATDEAEAAEWNEGLLYSQSLAHRGEPQDIVQTAATFGIALFKVKASLYQAWHQGTVQIVREGITIRNDIPTEQEQHVEEPVTEQETVAVPPAEEYQEPVAEEVEELHYDESDEVSDAPTFTLDETAETLTEEEAPVEETTPTYTAPVAVPQPVPAPPVEAVQPPLAAPTPVPPTVTPATTVAAPAGFDLGNLSALVEQVKQEVAQLDAEQQRIGAEVVEKQSQVSALTAAATQARQTRDEAAHQIAELTTRKEAADHAFRQAATDLHNQEQALATLKQQQQEATARRASITELFNQFSS